MVRLLKKRNQKIKQTKNTELTTTTTTDTTTTNNNNNFFKQHLFIPKRKFT